MKLQELCHFIVDCPHSTAPDEGCGIPLIRTPNIGYGRFNLERVHRVSEKVYQARCARAVPQNDDIIFAREAPAGNAAIIKNNEKMCLGQRTVLIRPNPEKVCPDFLVYYLLASEQQYKLLGTANGATVAHVNLPTIREMNVDNLPPIEVQRKIADVLSAYDDLIENNRKQIKLLEEAARRLYKEWFIDLRFPGYENTKIINGIPAGWERKCIGDICQTIGGGTPSTKIKEYYQGGTIKWVTPTDITRNNSIFLLDTEKKITNAGLSNSSAKLLPPFTILMTSRASVGYFALCEHEVCTNQGFISCIPHQQEARYFLLYNLMNRVDEIRQKAGGSTYLEINKNTFRSLNIIYPVEKICMDFTNILHPIMKRILSHKKMLKLAIDSRDYLLPKLMNGELEVK